MKIHSLTEAFLVENHLKWAGFNTGGGGGECGVHVVGGQLHLTPGTWWGPSLTSVSRFDLTDSWFAFEVLSRAPAGSTMNVHLKVDDNNRVGFFWDANGTDIVGLVKVAGVDTTSKVGVSAGDKWFRIREAAGDVFFETSADSRTWIPRWHHATTLNLSSVQVMFQTGAAADPVTVPFVVDNINLVAGGVVTGNAKMSTITDDFTTADAAKWSGWTVGNGGGGGSSGIQAINGRLVLTAGSWYSPKMESVSKYDLKDSWFAFEMVSRPADGHQSLAVNLMIDGQNMLAIVFAGSSATVAYSGWVEKIAGVDTPGTGSVAFHPLRHKWFRIRESGGTVFFETSADSATWIIRHHLVTTLDVKELTIQFVVGTDVNDPAAKPWILDNVNIIAGNVSFPTDVPLPSSLLTDTFDVEEPYKWYFPAGGGFSGNTGHLKAIPARTYTYVVTSDRWNMTDDGFAVQLTQNANRGAGTITAEMMVNGYVAAGAPENNVMIRFPGGDSGQLSLIETVAGVKDTAEVPFNRDLHKWFRIRHAGSTLFWEASRDGATWMVLRSKPQAFPVDSVTLQFNTGFYGTEPDPGVLLFDNLNLLNMHRLREIGWYVGTPLPFGAINAGTVQQRTFFEKADWLWNPIPDNPVLDPHSAEYVNELAVGQHSALLWRFGSKIVKPAQITASTPRYKFVMDMPWGASPLGEALVPIPDDTIIPPGSDGHLAVMDQEAGKVYSFWQAHKVGAEWHAGWAGVSEYHGDGRDYVGSATAGNLSRLAAMILVNEITAGEIPHALFFSSSLAGPGFRYPCQKSDGVNDAGVARPIDEGTRVQLDPTIDLAAIPNITPGELAVGRAFQKYGAYLADKAGSRMGVVFEFLQDGPDPGKEWTNAGLRFDYTDMIHIPWNKLRVLRNWNGT